MKILILSPRFPYPETGGDIVRINKVAYYLKSQGHEVILLTFYQNESQLNVERPAFDKIYSVRHSKAEAMLYMPWAVLKGMPLQSGYYYSPRFKKKLKEVLQAEKPDRIVAWLLRTTPYIDEMGLESETIVEMSDALSKTYTMTGKGKGSIVKKTAYAIERYLIGNYDESVITRYPKVILVAKQDIEFLHQNTKGDSSSLAFHTLGMDYLSERPAAADIDYNKICFVGHMSTLQNQDAVIRFVEEIFPKILAKNPNAKFYIVGADPSAKIKALASDHIIVTGFVDSIEDTIKDSCVAVAPVYVAAGLQNKVLFAMGCGVPVVMSSLIAKAIPEIRDGENCHVCNDADSFAESVLALMNDKQHRMQIGTAGYDVIREHYSWNERLKGYEDFDANKI